MYILYPSVTSSTLLPPARHFVLEQIHAEIPDAMITGPVFRQAVQIALQCRHLQRPQLLMPHKRTQERYIWISRTTVMSLTTLPFSLLPLRETLLCMWY